MSLLLLFKSHQVVVAPPPTPPTETVVSSGSGTSGLDLYGIRARSKYIKAVKRLKSESRKKGLKDKKSIQKAVKVLENALKREKNEENYLDELAYLNSLSIWSEYVQERLNELLQEAQRQDIIRQLNIQAKEIAASYDNNLKLYKLAEANLIERLKREQEDDEDLTLLTLLLEDDF